MGLFDFFKKSDTTTDNGILGPTHLDGFTEHIQNPKGLENIEWRRKIRSSSGGTKFRIRFYGQPHDVYPELIVKTDFAPPLVIAVDAASGEEITLYDGCKHGIDALFIETYTKEQIANRPADQFYKDQEGNDTFEIIYSVYYNTNYDSPDDEFIEQVDDDGFIQLPDDSKVEFEKVKRDGFDVISISVVNEQGERIEIVSAELS